MRETSYDVVLYGASGFVGNQTVRYFAEHAGDRVRWAIAGRDRHKLESVRAEVGIDVDSLVADSQDRTAIDTIVSQTRVLLNTAGPFALYGDAIVDACVRYGTHYVDITGETPWVPPESVPADVDRHRDPTSPQYDVEMGTWVAPFFMGVVNTRIVRRSWALFDRWQESYGTDFSYQEYFKFDPPWKWLQSAAMVGGMQRGGILTPATGLGDVLVERLQRAGMRLEVETIG
jgi:short subunit dehydrogenase-like uncharacterized protein